VKANLTFEFLNVVEKISNGVGCERPQSDPRELAFKFRLGGSEVDDFH
jgi:hypothetical protein